MPYYLPTTIYSVYLSFWQWKVWLVINKVGSYCFVFNWTVIKLNQDIMVSWKPNRIVNILNNQLLWHNNRNVFQSLYTISSWAKGDSIEKMKSRPNIRVVGLEFIIIKEGKLSLLIIESIQLFAQIGVLRPPSEIRSRPVLFEPPRLLSSNYWKCMKIMHQNRSL